MELRLPVRSPGTLIRKTHEKQEVRVRRESLLAARNYRRVNTVHL